MMCQIKKVGDWLEVYGRVKKKIYGGAFEACGENLHGFGSHECSDWRSATMSYIIGDRQL